MSLNVIAAKDYKDTIDFNALVDMCKRNGNNFMDIRSLENMPYDRKWLYLVLNNNNIVGFYVIIEIYPSLIIKWICSEATSKELKIGTRIMQFIETYARKKKMKYIVLESIGSAIGFYEKMGYSKDFKYTAAAIFFYHFIKKTNEIYKANYNRFFGPINEIRRKINKLKDKLDNVDNEEYQNIFYDITKLENDIVDIENSEEYVAIYWFQIEPMNKIRSNYRNTNSTTMIKELEPTNSPREEWIEISCNEFDLSNMPEEYDELLVDVIGGLCNSYNSSFTIKDEKWLSVDHYYYYTLSDDEVRNQITEQSQQDYYDFQEYLSNLSISPTIEDSIKTGTLISAMIAKFTTHKDLSNILLITKGARLAFGVSPPVWSLELEYVRDILELKVPIVSDNIRSMILKFI